MSPDIHGVRRVCWSCFEHLGRWPVWHSHMDDPLSVVSLQSHKQPTSWLTPAANRIGEWGSLCGQGGWRRGSCSVCYPRVALFGWGAGVTSINIRGANRAELTRGLAGVLALGPGI